MESALEFWLYSMVGIKGKNLGIGFIALKFVAISN
jgi:hypothetical protein